MTTEQKQESPLNCSSYLLRLWFPVAGKNPSRLASLQSLTTGERQEFAHPESLFLFLEAASKVPPNAEDPSGQGGRSM
jgi:hypothetical protein